MSIAPIEQLKQHISRLVNTSNIEFADLESFFEIRTIKRKQHLLRPPQICRHESYIVSGLFQTSFIDENAEEHILYFPHEDWWTGDFKSFRNIEPATLQIIALENSVVLQITKNRLEQLYTLSPVFERFFRILNENSAIALQTRLIQLFSSKAETNYHSFLKKYPKIVNRLNRKQIAGYLNITPQYLSQLK